jgi:hypothetical protein
VNAVEIEEAISELALQPFDTESFPYEFLIAMGNKPTTIKRLKTGSTNKSDVGGVLQTNNIHISIAEAGQVTETLAVLKASPATSRAKAKYVLATDGIDFEAEQLQTGETVACEYENFPDHFGFFLPLAGITTVKEIRENAFDIKATSRLNKLYVELLKDNPEWTKDERREDMNHFMARLIFSFFAEDTNIFNATDLFTKTIEQMSARDASNTHEVIAEVFRAMNTKTVDRDSANIARWASSFPYVNGGLFGGNEDVPRFSKIARSYLLHVGNLDWTKINPDIFGSMIQAVADEEERGELGMHYTSVPNILKVLNPLFLDELREQLEQAGDNPRKLLNLRKRIARIRVFDPACGSGNFLVIAYKQLREIEYEINRRREEVTSKTVIPLTNFRGIELRHFSAEIARLALIIAEYQCDVEYLGQQQALQEFLPLQADNWITCGNALRLDWLRICPPTGIAAKLVGDDLFETSLDQAEIDFENEGGETFICGNPPYLGDKKQSPEQKADMESIFKTKTTKWRSLDYVSGWFLKAVEYGASSVSKSAFVATNSICQGQQTPVLWPLILSFGYEINFAFTSFSWSNLASHNAGVTVIIIGISRNYASEKLLYSVDKLNEVTVRKCANISPYLTPSPTQFVEASSKPLAKVSEMLLGNFAKDGGHLCIEPNELPTLSPHAFKYLKPMYGGNEFIKGLKRYCLWVDDTCYEDANQDSFLADRFSKVRSNRLASPKKATQNWAEKPYKFVEVRSPSYKNALILPIVSSENRDYFPVGLLPQESVVNYAFALYDAPVWNMALIASRIHLVWIATVCGKLETRYRYSNTLGWNTFPVPNLTEKNKADLTACAENILLAREAHYPATIADLYDPDNMPDNLRAAHERNDEVLERIYIGRRFKNDTERLEKLFELYTKMTKAA